MAVLGIDSTAPYNSCDPDIIEKTKLKTMLHKAIEDRKDTGKLQIHMIQLNRFPQLPSS
jgi:hypothetical protein